MINILNLPKKSAPEQMIQTPNEPKSESSFKDIFSSAIKSEQPPAAEMKGAQSEQYASEANNSEKDKSIPKDENTASKEEKSQEIKTKTDENTKETLAALADANLHLKEKPKKNISRDLSQLSPKNKNGKNIDSASDAASQAAKALGNAEHVLVNAAKKTAADKIQKAASEQLGFISPLHRHSARNAAEKAFSPAAENTISKTLDAGVSALLGKIQKEKIFGAAKPAAALSEAAKENNSADTNQTRSALKRSVRHSQTEKTPTQSLTLAQSESIGIKSEQSAGEPKSAQTVETSGKKGDSSSKESFNFDFSGSRVKKESHEAKNANPAARGVFSEQIRQIIEQARFSVRDKANATMNIKLNPDNMGQMNVKLGLENGVLSARFIVENVEAKQELLSNMNSIIDSLSKEGLNLGSFNVDVRGGEKGGEHFSETQKHAEIVTVKNEEAATIYEYAKAEHSGEINLVG